MENITFNHTKGYAVQAFGNNITLAMSLTDNNWATVYINGKPIKEYTRFTTDKWRKVYNKLSRISNIR